MNMRLLGAPTLKDVVPTMVDASNVHTHIVAVPGDNLYNNNCEFFCGCSSYWCAMLMHRRIDRRDDAASPAEGTEGETLSSELRLAECVLCYLLYGIWFLED